MLKRMAQDFCLPPVHSVRGYSELVVIVAMHVSSMSICKSMINYPNCGKVSVPTARSKGRNVS